MSINRWTFTGNIGADAEIRENKTTKEKFITMSVAISDSYKDPETNLKVENTEWIDCSLKFENFKNVAPFLKKGTHVTVAGKPSSYIYKAKDAKEAISKMKVFVREIDFYNAKPQLVDSSTGEIIGKA